MTGIAVDPMEKLLLNIVLAALLTSDYLGLVIDGSEPTPELS